MDIEKAIKQVKIKITALNIDRENQRAGVVYDVLYKDKEKWTNNLIVQNTGEFVSFHKFKEAILKQVREDFEIDRLVQEIKPRKGKVFKLVD